MKKLFNFRLLVLIGVLIMSVSHVKAWDVWGNLYFNNTSKSWTYVGFIVGNDGYSTAYKLTKLDNTNLYYKWVEYEGYNDAYFFNADWDGSESNKPYDRISYLSSDDRWQIYKADYKANKPNGPGQRYYFDGVDNSSAAGGLPTYTAYLRIRFDEGSGYGSVVTGGDTWDHGVTFDFTGTYMDGDGATGQSTIENLDKNKWGDDTWGYGGIPITGEVTFDLKSLDTGFEIEGWAYDEEDETTPVYTTNVTNPTFNVLGNTSYVAFIRHKSYTVTLNDNGGSGGSGSKTVKYDESTNMTSNVTVPTKSGYSFQGYYTSNDGTGSMIINSSGTWQKDVTNYTGTDGSSNPKWVRDGGVILYAKWTQSVNLNANDGTGGDASVTMTYNSSSHASITNPTREGYTFAGWYAASDGNKQVMNASGALQSGVSSYTTGTNWTWSGTAPTLYAHWTANNYTITLNNNGATSAGDASVEVTYDSDAQLSFTAPSKTNYYLDGWYTGSGGTGEKVLNEDGYIQWNTGYLDGYTDASGHWKKADNITLYARWKANTSDDKYTFSYGSGTRYSSSWTVAAFTQVGSTNEWNIADFTLPNPSSKAKFFVGYEEDFYRTADLGYNGAVSSEVNMEDMLLLPSSSLMTGTATGAVGKLVIWDNASADNLYVGFRPSGYGLTYASGTIAFNTWSDTYFCETNVVTLTSSDASGNFQVKLAASSGYVACGHGTAEAASAVNGRKITGDADIANGKKGVFQIQQDGSANNFGLKFVTVHDVSFNMQDHGSAISDYTDIRYNSKISAPSDPSAAGYTFGGWYKEPACTNEWDFANDVVTEATTLYAKWTANTLTFNGSVASHETEWNNTGNWSEAIVPTIDHQVVISKPVTVNTNAAKAKSITFSGTGTLTIPATGALEVAGAITNTNPNNIIIKSSNTNQGALIFNSTGGTYATVEMALKYADPKVGKFQMVAIPIPYVDVSAAFAGTGAYTFTWKHGTGWDQRGYYDGFSSFEAVLVKGKAGTSFSGALVSTTDKSYTGLSIAAVDNGDVYMFGNSWTAPIRRTNVTCTNATISILDGSSQNWDGVVSGELIPALQGYAVVVDEGKTGSVGINYTNAVRTATTPNEPLHAPKRYADEDPEPITVYVSGNELRTRIRLFEDETRFSDDLDDGWEAYYMEGGGLAGEMYAVGPEKKMNVLATANLEGTVVGFVPGQETDYTISFAGDGKGYYLNDVKTGKSTRIDEANTYEFTSDPSTNATRFVISKTPMSPTGIEDVVDGANARKQMIDGSLYIIRDGRIYTATGNVVK